MHELFSQFAQPEGEKTFIFSPGGADHGNVYSTWPALMSAVQATAGPKQIDGPESGSFVAAKLIKDVAELEAQGRGREEAERTTRLVACVFADYFGRGDTDFNQDAFFEECGLSGEFIARMSKARKKHGRGNNPKNWIDE
jgi:hypothetical protein